MANRMDQGYFEEKQEFAHKGLEQAVIEIKSSVALIKAMKYSIPGLVDASQVHEILKCAENIIKNSRRDFEKACWTSERTDLEFNDWLKERKLEELVWGE